MTYDTWTPIERTYTAQVHYDKWSSQGARVLNLFLLLFPKSLEYLYVLCMTYVWLCCDINNLISRIDDNDKEGMEIENDFRVVYVSIPRWISAETRKARNTNELKEVEYKQSPQNFQWTYFVPNFRIVLICLSFKTNIRTGCLVFHRFNFFRKRYCYCCGRPRYRQSRANRNGAFHGNKQR